MSDPVTNVQIEDVLSSIRRLVSTDDRPDADENTQTQSDDISEKLVLTPSLRVTDNDTHQDQPSDTEDAAEQENDWTADTQNDDQSDQHDDVEDATEEEHDQLERVADADDGNPVLDVWAEDDLTPEDQLDDEHDHDDDHSDTSDDAGWQDDDHADDTHAQENTDADELTARVAGFEEAVAARDDGWEPDGDSDDDNAAQPMTPLSWGTETDQSSDTDQTGTDIEDAEVVSAQEGLEPFVPDEDIDLTPELDQVIENATASAASAATNAFAAADDPLGDEATILDEEALRDLVTDIVREELQGALGERITRNVRKLVRREIHRALATQELE